MEYDLCWEVRLGGIRDLREEGIGCGGMICAEEEVGVR